MCRNDNSNFSVVVMTTVIFQLESLDVRCDGGLEGPEGRLLEVCAGKLTKCSMIPNIRAEHHTHMHYKFEATQSQMKDGAP